MTKKIKKTAEELRETLTEEQHYVTRQKGTERPFTGKYHNHKEEGVYKCIGCGKELFRSHTKFDSGTGWPSFSEPASHENIILKKKKMRNKFPY